MVWKVFAQVGKKSREQEKDFMEATGVNDRSVQNEWTKDLAQERCRFHMMGEKFVAWPHFVLLIKWLKELGKQGTDHRVSGLE